jgi:predicted transcriptional regulator of viral defense system
VPKGVICLVSALAFHGITDQMPRRVWIAIGPKDWKPQIDYPPLRIVRFTDKFLRDSVETHDIGGVSVPIFGVAKTIADVFRHRRSVGIDVAVPALKEALCHRSLPAESSRTSLDDFILFISMLLWLPGRCRIAPDGRKSFPLDGAWRL